jgi:hypothetical protein
MLIVERLGVELAPQPPVFSMFDGRISPNLGVSWKLWAANGGRGKI